MFEMREDCTQKTAAGFTIHLLISLKYSEMNLRKNQKSSFLNSSAKRDQCRTSSPSSQTFILSWRQSIVLSLAGAVAVCLFSIGNYSRKVTFRQAIVTIGEKRCIHADIKQSHTFA